MSTDVTSPPSEATRAAPQKSGGFGLPTATALVIGSLADATAVLDGKAGTTITSER